MTRDELKELIRDNHFSDLHSYTEDNIANLVKEIYHDGMVEGYEMAIFRLQMLGTRMPFDCSQEYVKKNGDKIKTILNALYDADGPQKKFDGLWGD